MRFTQNLKIMPVFILMKEASVWLSGVFQQILDRKE